MGKKLVVVEINNILSLTKATFFLFFWVIGLRSRWIGSQTDTYMYRLVGAFIKFNLPLVSNVSSKGLYFPIGILWEMQGSCDFSLLYGLATGFLGVWGVFLPSSPVLGFPCLKKFSLPCSSALLLCKSASLQLSKGLMCYGEFQLALLAFFQPLVGHCHDSGKSWSHMWGSLRALWT